MQESSVFTKIINNEVPAHRIYEDDRVIAILTNHPLTDGHTLVIPKKQVSQIWDMESDDFHYLWQVAQKIALHLKGVMGVDRVGVVVKGFEVPHTHIHLVPVNFHSGISFDPEPSPPETSDDTLSLIAERIRFS